MRDIAAAGGSAAKGAPRSAGTPKKPSKAQQRKRVQRIHRGVRWAIQLAFFVLAPGLFAASFNGVRYLCEQVGLTQGSEVTSFVALLALLCAFTVVFGRFFCGFACAFGTLGDVVYLAATPLRKALRLEGKHLPERAQRVLQKGKFAILILVCALCYLGMSAVIPEWDPWVAFAAFTAGNLEGVAATSFVVLGVMVAGMAFQERFFCQNLCPMGAVFALLPVLPQTAFTRLPQRCPSACGQCKANCPVGVYPDPDAYASGECIACGRCADVCPLSNVGLARLELALAEERLSDPAPAVRVGGLATAAAGAGAGAQASLKAAVSQNASSGSAVRRAAKTAKAKPAARFKGTGVAWTCVKALALLGFCWAMGQLRFVPSFEEISALFM